MEEAQKLQKLRANKSTEKEIPFKQPKLELSKVPENSKYKADHFNGLNIGILHFSGNQKYEFLLSEFEELDIISIGRNITKKYLHKTTQQKVAIKFINIPTNAKDDTFKKLRKEIELHFALRHSKHIVEMFGFNILNEQLIICTELMDMSVYEFYIWTHQRINSFPEDLLGLIGINILNALIDCKSIQIIHRDIKPQNILINKSGHIKLCDFGTSRLLEDSFATTTTTGTFLYFPPERFDPSIEKYDVRSDVWSLGLTLAEIGYGKYPLDVHGHTNIIKLSQIITKVDGAKLVEGCLAFFSNDIKLFVRLCLERLENRPKLDELQATNLYKHYSKLNHPTYIQSLIDKIEIDLTREHALYDSGKLKNKADHFNGLNIGILHFSGNQKYEFLLSEFEELDKISVGRNITKKYLHKTTQQKVAIKFIDIPTNAKDDTFKKLRKEIELHFALRHSKHIVEMFGFNILNEQLIICTELMDMSVYDFYIWTHQRINSFPEDLLGLIGINILNALIDCKSIQIIHRDIKPQNILINKSGHIKLCDFGTSRLLEDSFATTTGTFLYFPPERFDLSIEKYDVRSDVWSLGLTLAEIGYGKYPLGVPEHTSIIKLIQIITKVDGAELVEGCLASFSNDIKLFVGLCLERLENRPKLDGLHATSLYQHYSELNHPTYIQSLIDKIEVDLTQAGSPAFSDDTPILKKEASDFKTTIDNIKKTLDEIINGKNDDVAPLFDELLCGFYELEILDLPKELLLKELEVIKPHIHACEKDLHICLIDFIHFVSNANVDVGEFETYTICQNRSGLQRFIDSFESSFGKFKYLKLWSGKKGFIESLDREIKRWQKYYFCLGDDKIDPHFSKSSKKETHWWWWS